MPICSVLSSSLNNASASPIPSLYSLFSSEIGQFVLGLRVLELLSTNLKIESWSPMPTLYGTGSENSGKEGLVATSSGICRAPPLCPFSKTRRG